MMRIWRHLEQVDEFSAYLAIVMALVVAALAMLAWDGAQAVALWWAR